MAQRNRSLPSHMRNWTANPPLKGSRSTFNLSHTVKTTFDAGLLIPFLNLETLPADTIKCRVNAFARLATPLKPVMDNIHLSFQFWYCPARQLWSNWPKFMGEQDNPTDSTDFLVPQIGLSQASGTAPKILADYMGIPISNADGSGTLNVNAMPFRMYNRVWNFHYRDQNLQDSIPQPDGDGPDGGNLYELKRRGKRHDYLTTSLPFQQKGTPVPLALGGTAPIFTTSTASGDDQVFGYGVNATQRTKLFSNATTRELQFETAGITTDAQTVFADLGAATSATVTQLRQSIAIQHVLERDARGGTRYPEQLLSRFGVVDPQLLVHQRPEYLGGGEVPINIAPVPSTVPTPEQPNPNNVQGNLAAVGTASAYNIGFTKSITEHGWIMGIVSARADLTYQQNLERQWLRRERFDYFTPELAHISEQPVFNAEIYADGTSADQDVWGYQGAYDEYRHKQNHLNSRFRSKPIDGETLHVWHLAQEFGNRPQLNASFIEDNPPMARVLAVNTEPHFICDISVQLIAARRMPITGIPGLSRI